MRGNLMKAIGLAVAAAAAGAVVVAAAAPHRPAGLAQMRGPYLGQKPPGRSPEIFAPELITPPRATTVRWPSPLTWMDAEIIEDLRKTIER